MSVSPLIRVCERCRRSSCWQGNAMHPCDMQGVASLDIELDTIAAEHNEHPRHLEIAQRKHYFEGFHRVTCGAATAIGNVVLDAEDVTCPSCLRYLAERKRQWWKR